MTSLQELRTRIDTIDQSIIQALSQSGDDEDYLDNVSVLTPGDKEALRGTRLYFSQKVCELLHERMGISVEIGRVKHAEGRTSMVDEVRKKIMINSRVDWAPEELKPQVEKFYHIIHDISARIQNDIDIEG